MIALTCTEYLWNSKNQQEPEPVFPGSAPCFLSHFIPSSYPPIIQREHSSRPGPDPHPSLSQAFSSILHLLLRNSEACADFPQRCSPPECWDLGWGVAPLYNSALNARSKCLRVQRQTSLLPRVNAWWAEMLSIFGKLVQLRSLKKDMLKAFWAISFVSKFKLWPK